MGTTTAVVATDHAHALEAPAAAIVRAMIETGETAGTAPTPGPVVQPETGRVADARAHHRSMKMSETAALSLCNNLLPVSGAINLRGSLKRMQAR